MYLIQQITQDKLQHQNLILPDGTSLSLTLKFIEQQYGWFIAELIYGSFTLTGMRITNQPNMLHPWKNKLTFGLGCFSTGNREPSLIQDFSSGASQLYILSSEEVAQYAALLSSG